MYCEGDFKDKTLLPTKNIVKNTVYSQERDVKSQKSQFS